jgi:hypothetical protein
MTGFYPYGEIALFSLGERSELHNQTITITTFAEGWPPPTLEPVTA